MKKNARSFFCDSVWSIAGLLLMNAAAQFLVYPLWNRKLGTDTYGMIIFLLSVSNISAITIGSACCYTRITLSADRNTKNAAYNRILLLASIIPIISGLTVCIGSHQTPANIIAYIFLGILTMWRCYADVEFRLYLNYKGYFLYYLLIASGYCLGIYLMSVTKVWSAALIPGELLGLFYIRFKGHIFSPDSNADASKEETAAVYRLFFVLCGSYLLNTLIFNADRILLKNTEGNTAVSVYYAASLCGKTLSLIVTPFNAVISGYLMRSDRSLTKNTVIKLNIAAAFLAAASAGCCTIGSYILIPFLYPDIYPVSKDYFFIANLAQTVYFASNLTSVVILRYADKKHQLFSNLIYTSAFALICIPVTYFIGIQGFYFSFLITSFSRMLYNMIVLLRITGRSRE